MHEGPSALLPLLRVEDLRKAAQPFKLRTCATDGWHPRHYGLLCDDALAVLARVLWLVELFGDFPKKTRGLQVRLITAKRRPIGWYKGLFRVWAASRRKLVRLWEERWASQACFNTGAGKAVGDGVWRAAVRSNLEVDKGRHYAEVLYDVRKCFENVNFSTLRRNAAAVGYPEVLLRVSLHSYRWQRTICDGVLAVRPLRATRQAIVAGSAFATFELKALFVLPMTGHMRRIPEARALRHVDDLAAGVSSGTLAGLERGVVVLHTDLKGVFQELGLPLAEDKLALIASSRAAMTRLRANRVLRDLLPEQAVKKLGYDYIAGNRAAKGRSHVRRGRIQAAMGRLKRIRWLRRASGKQSKLVYTGAIPAAFYGSEVTGCPPSRWHCFRARAASVCGLGGGGGANLDLVWQLARRGGVNDPGAQALVAPLVRYVKEWWLQASEKASLGRVALRPEELLEGFRRAQCRLAKSTNWTKISYDPIAQGWMDLEECHRVHRPRRAASQHRLGLARGGSAALPRGLGETCHLRRLAEVAQRFGPCHRAACLGDGWHLARACAQGSLSEGQGGHQLQGQGLSQGGFHWQGLDRGGSGPERLLHLRGLLPPRVWPARHAFSSDLHLRALRGRAKGACASMAAAAGREGRSRCSGAGPGLVARRAWSGRRLQAVAMALALL